MFYVVWRERERGCCFLFYSSLFTNDVHPQFVEIVYIVRHQKFNVFIYEYMVWMRQKTQFAFKILQDKEKNKTHKQHWKNIKFNTSKYCRIEIFQKFN